MTGARRTPLHALHVELGARMVPFAGWEMPLHYPAGVLQEHLHCRAGAALFDVSHMGQIEISASSPDAAAHALEALVPADLAGLAEGRQRYGLLTGESGGILDDLMIARLPGRLLAVVNASRADADIRHLSAGLAGRARPEPLASQALLALQGPGAEAALAPLAPWAAELRFMAVAAGRIAPDGVEAIISRSGYTGEDGFEISVPAEAAEQIARALLAQPSVMPAGLGARDSLRLEAGLCLHGSDIDTATTPAEASLGWAIPRVRRTGGDRAGGFPGAARILSELAQGPDRLRVGLRPQGRAPMRAGTPLFAHADAADPIGAITSGGFGPSLQAPVAMGYVAASHAAPGTSLWGELRGRREPAEVVRMPFITPTYRR